MGHHEPVTDWATDFDHTDDMWAADPYPIWEELRSSCPVAHSGRYGGVWLPTRYDDVAAIAYDTERFSSRSVVMSNATPSVTAARMARTRRVRAVVVRLGVSTASVGAIGVGVFGPRSSTTPSSSKPRKRAYSLRNARAYAGAGYAPGGALDSSACR